MKKMMIGMTFLMGFTMSICLSLLGTLTSGHFSVPSFLISFGISFALSLMIGFSVPVKPLGDKICEKWKVNPRSFKGTAVSALVSDLIYSPFITIVMEVVMLKNAAEHAPEGAVPPIGKVLPGSLLLCLAVAYVVIMITQPLFVRLLMRGMKVGDGPMPSNFDAAKKGEGNEG